MLKIKDSVDLKELEKYNFRFYDNLYIIGETRYGYWYGIDICSKDMEVDFGFVDVKMEKCKKGEILYNSDGEHFRVNNLNDILDADYRELIETFIRKEIAEKVEVE